MDRKSGTARPSRILRLAAGWALTLAGIVLWLLPVVPGFFLLVPGLGILIAESRWLRILIRRHREKRLMKRALRGAERVGLKIDLDAHDDGDGPASPEG